MRLVQKLWIGMAMLSLSFTASAYDFEVDGLCYDVVDLVELTCGVSGTTKSLDFSKEVVIPSHVSFLGKTLTVVSIMDNAFKKTDIVSISLPNTCTSIGEYAFYYCKKLKSINIPEGVTSIEFCTFSGCSSLTHINIPDGVTSIKSYAFSNCTSLTQVNIHEGVTSIKSYAFSNCTSLTHINIPEGVKSIENDAFAYCSSLTQVNIPKGVTSISYSTFEGCSSLTQVNIPDGVTSIGSSAFENCSSLSHITIPEGVTTIGDDAFKQSTITSLCISDSNQKLEFGSKAFDNSKIKDLYIGRELEWNSYDIYAIFYNADIDSLTIGNRVTKIGVEFFAGERVGGIYIYSVKSVQKLNILPSEKTLNIYSTTSLNPNVLILGRNLDGFYIFSYATNLKHLEVCGNVANISNLSLRDSDISTMLVKTATPPIGANGTFSKNTYLYCSLKVPVGTLNAYKSAEGWKNFWNIDECDFSGVEAIEEDNAVSCAADNGGIRIENKDENSIVRVYNIQGSMLAETSESVVNNLPKGLYIVTVENKSFKVSLR